MKFVDSVKIHVRSGTGGAGCSSFRREKYVPRGGPDGGDGGSGGNIIFYGDPQKNTLLDLSFNQHQHAFNGQTGAGKNRHGKNGQDRRIPLPLGTVVKDSESGEVLLEILDAKSYLFLKGGQGGAGNARFKSSTNQAPDFHHSGKEGQERWLRLELKLMANVGLVGLPNAGKSTFIRAVSHAHPKVADYPFTTLVPHLGVVRTENYETFVVADIPGIIQGAHAGGGLGDRFLRHIERTSILAILLDISEYSEHSPLDAYYILLNELKLFSIFLIEKPRLIILTKLDTVYDQQMLEELSGKLESLGEVVFAVSAISGKNLQPALQFMANIVNN